MEKRNGAGEPADDHNTGTWIIALTGPGDGFIGRVKELDGENPYEYSVNSGLGCWTAEVRVEVPASMVLGAKVITLCPVYDYRERVKEIPILVNGKPMQDPQMPGYPAMQPMRTPLVMPVGFTMEPAAVHVPGICHGTSIRFFSQMDRRDAETYRGFAKATRDAMKTMRLDASNLTAPSRDDITRITGSKA